MKTANFVLRLALAFVVVWFGINELLSTSDWVTFVPAFFGQGALATDLVIVHGLILSALGLLLALNVYPRIAASLLSIMLFEIIIDLLFASGLSDIAVRDVGLFGMALALAFTPTVTAPASAV